MIFKLYKDTTYSIYIGLEILAGISEPQLLPLRTINIPQLNFYPVYQK